MINRTIPKELASPSGTDGPRAIAVIHIQRYSSKSKSDLGRYTDGKVHGSRRPWGL